jgi:hypothetical protein
VLEFFGIDVDQEIQAVKEQAQQLVASLSGAAATQIGAVPGPELAGEIPGGKGGTGAPAEKTEVEVKAPPRAGQAKVNQAGRLPKRAHTRKGLARLIRQDPRPIPLRLTRTVRARGNRTPKLPPQPTLLALDKGPTTEALLAECPTVECLAAGCPAVAVCQVVVLAAGECPVEVRCRRQRVAAEASAGLDWVVVVSVVLVLAGVSAAAEPQVGGSRVSCQFRPLRVLPQQLLLPRR